MCITCAGFLEELMRFNSLMFVGKFTHKYEIKLMVGAHRNYFKFWDLVILRNRNEF